MATIHIPTEHYKTIKEISIMVDSRGVRPFVEDFFTHYAIYFAQTGSFITPGTYKKVDDTMGISPDVGADTKKRFRLMALRADSNSMESYMREMLVWLSNKYRSDKWVWFDDSNAYVIPVRTR